MMTVNYFKQKFREQNVNPLRVTWRGQVGYSYLVFESMDQVDEGQPVCMLGLRLHILVAGSTFNLHTRIASPGKLQSNKK